MRNSAISDLQEFQECQDWSDYAPNSVFEVLTRKAVQEKLNALKRKAQSKESAKHTRLKTSKHKDQEHPVSPTITNTVFTSPMEHTTRQEERRQSSSVDNIINNPNNFLKKSFSFSNSAEDGDPHLAQTHRSFRLQFGVVVTRVHSTERFELNRQNGQTITLAQVAAACSRAKETSQIERIDNTESDSTNQRYHCDEQARGFLGKIGQERQLLQHDAHYPHQHGGLVQVATQAQDYGQFIELGC
jgi:hypothetical protein